MPKLKQRDDVEDQDQEEDRNEREDAKPREHERAVADAGGEAGKIPTISWSPRNNCARNLIMAASRSCLPERM